jgi:hypothetical protein
MGSEERRCVGGSPTFEKKDRIMKISTERAKGAVI